MPSPSQAVFRGVVVILALFCVTTVAACSGGSSSGTSTPAGQLGANASPAALPNTLTIRGQKVDFPPQTVIINQTTECQSAETAQTAACADDLKLITLGDSYILYDPKVPRVDSKKIDPAQTAVLQPVLDLIQGRASSNSPSPSTAG